MNTELFAKIDEVTPTGSFDMDSWEDDDACGTTRCVAGWAIHFTTGSPLYDAEGRAHPEVQRLAERLFPGSSPDPNAPDFERLGLKLLGLQGEDRELFYSSPRRAREFVRLAANGQEAAAQAVLRDLDS